MKKIIKVPCFCNPKCSGGIVSEFSFVQRATRNIHEKRDLTAEARRTAYCNLNGVPQQGILLNIITQSLFYLFYYDQIRNHSS